MKYLILIAMQFNYDWNSPVPFQCTLDSLIDDTLVIKDTPGRYPKNNKRHPCNKRHSRYLGEKKINDTQAN